MAAIEKEIIEKFRLLNKDAQKRVLAQLSEQLSWLDETRALRAEMRERYGKLAFSSAEVLNEIREERLNDLMDRY